MTEESKKISHKKGRLIENACLFLILKILFLYS